MIKTNDVNSREDFIQFLKEQSEDFNNQIKEKKNRDLEILNKSRKKKKAGDIFVLNLKGMITFLVGL